MSQVHKATIIGSISIVLWGTLALLTQLTGGLIPTFQMMAMTFGLAFLCMLLYWRSQGHWGLKHLKQPSKVWWLGVGGYFSYHFCYFMAMKLAPAVEVSLITYLWPLLIVLFSALLPNEKLRIAHIAGAIMAFSGCWMLIYKDGAQINVQHIPGYLFALSCAFIWSLYSVASRCISSVSSNVVAWFCAGTALLAVFCHLLWEETYWDLDTSQWLGVIGLGVGPIGIAFITWDYGIKHGNLSLLGVFAYMTPLISVLFLVISGSTQLNEDIITACIAIICGSLLAGLLGKSANLKQSHQ
ncbi:DMT family transporter [Pseudoteredinibacter isoporae]|uniref:Drug/metabolite transporter (DMT)-like permease n=1 Tax=Pseudoteredinibacter isoporae TaxID=570281 RepID=A0A7X0JQB9_9GAMM|nr:EamA family transporter [Pseudoteredinibacter isoporae]MBB6520237.1 drug/metabolite transporter (DMT)-like permease [Pseudoteredinibacter isoporae]NHO85809.1 EamA family transporter [Pseudoteredinibacter isoporae]NIB25739.1 EamA family transporter [Pseudoteredinibacter isoporae]